VRFGPNVIEQVGRVYRNIRNRMRFMLSNLDDLAAGDVVTREAMEPIDRLACTVADAFVAGVKNAYDRCQIHDAYLRIVEFESTMSSLYFDALKDPLYSRARNDPRRRSAQSALLYVLTRFLTAVAPVLSFTAEEAWQHLPQWARASAQSVFDSSFDAGRFRGGAEGDLALWERLRELRARVAASPSPRDFEARLVLTTPAPAYKLLAALGDNLREALVVSQLELRAGDAEEFELFLADGEKCARCWKYRELGGDPEHPEICADCAQVVLGLEHSA
jgi:isoleucyl-tRNA synthetase